MRCFASDRSTFLSIGTVIAALALAACGHDNGNSATSASATTGSEGNGAQAATVKDSGTTSECNGAWAAGDRNPGDTTGQGLDAFGAAWYVLSPASDQVTSSSGGGHGY